MHQSMPDPRPLASDNLAKPSADRTRHDRSAQPAMIMETPGQTIRRQRISRTEHHARQRRALISRLALAILPFLLFALGLALVSAGIFRYLEQESAISLFLQARRPSALHGAGWSEPPAIGEPGVQPTPAAAEPIRSASGRLVTPFYYIGQQIGTLRFPSLDLEVGTFQGDSEQEFRKGAGHYVGSFLPGQDGNILIAAHRTSHFRKFEHIQVGDAVHFVTTYGEFTYRVRELRIIDEKDTSVAQPTDTEQLTLYTCYPFRYVGNAPKRFVVICDPVEQAVRT